jgi:hypothetical protein
MYAEREAKREAARHAFDQLHYEVMHNLVLETTRLGIEVKNLKMRVESLTSRLEFNERRARALESVVVYKPSPEDRIEAPPVRETRREEPVPVNREAAARPPTPGGQPQAEGPGQRSRRRRRRRGRRGGGSVAAIMGNAAGGALPGQPVSDAPEPGQEPVIAHAADRAIQEAQQHHEAPDLEPEAIGESDPGDSEGSDDER